MQIKNLLKCLNKVHLEELILETFILELIVNGTKSHENNLMSWEILYELGHNTGKQYCSNYYVSVTNMVLNVEHP